jgi:xanthine dehydrogenase FAD-binding subunit
MSYLSSFYAPDTIDEAAVLLADKATTAVVLAGGTDLMVRNHQRLLPDHLTGLVSIHRINEMQGVRLDGHEIVIGARTTATELMRDSLINEAVPILAQVADRMASAQIRNVATIGGNLVNASPAGDLINPLLLLDARIVLVSAQQTRSVAVHELFTGPGETVLLPYELLSEVRFVKPQEARVFCFEKAGTRPAMECSVLTVGLGFTPRGRCLTDVRVAFGSAAPTPLRGRQTEAVLEGQRLTPDVIEAAIHAADVDVQPISDIRASECYRRALAAVFLRRMLVQAGLFEAVDGEKQ